MRIVRPTVIGLLLTWQLGMASPSFAQDAATTWHYPDDREAILSQASPRPYGRMSGVFAVRIKYREPGFRVRNERGGRWLFHWASKLYYSGKLFALVGAPTVVDEDWHAVGAVTAIVIYDEDGGGKLETVEYINGSATYVVHLPGWLRHGLELKPREVTDGMQSFVLSAYPAHSFRLRLPLGFAISELRSKFGVDYEVWKRDIPESSASFQVTVTCDFHIAPPIMPYPEKGKIGGRDVWWNVWTEPKGGKPVYRRALLIQGWFPDSRGARCMDPDGIRVVISGSGTDKEELARFAEALSNLEPISRKRD